ncbi:MAG: acyltransferase family protein [Clostridia bacterium]|nr:acyltransferase family protein [Clostridia bacterium]
MADAVKKRNGEIDFFKFVASIYVVLFHSRAFYNPDLFKGAMALAVEFFFVVSGYFFARSVYGDKRKFRGSSIGTETLGFMRHKIGGFIYYFLLGFACSFAAGFYRKGFELFSLVNVKDFIYEFFLLTLLTGTSSKIVPADWYLSAMLVAMFVLYPLFRYKKDLFSGVIAPIVGIGGLGYLMNKYGILAAGGDGDFPSKGLIRAFVGICVGVFAYRISEMLKAKEFGKVGKTILSLVSCVCVISTFVLFINMPAEVQSLPVFLSMIFVAISTSGKSYFSRLFPVRICQKLGEFSLAIYLAHSAVRSFLLGLRSDYPVLKLFFSNGNRQWVGVLIYVICSAILAIVFMALTSLIKKARQKKAAATAAV